MSGFVYALGAESGPVKIGWSADPVRRLAKVRSDCPSHVHLIGLVEASREQEAEIHRLLAPWRVRREWYWHDGAVRIFVAMLPPARPRIVRRRRPVPDNASQLAKWIGENTTQCEFARAVGCSQPHLSAIMAQKKEPSLDLANRISKATGRAVPIEAFVRQPPEAAE